LRLQKYVFLADCYGLNSGYNIYVGGPYSEKLAEDYYSLSESPSSEASLPPEFRISDFIKLVDGKKPKWLEIVVDHV
jgi:uncharacterized protein YwgA